MFRGLHINFLARLTLGQPAVCPKAIWTLTRAKGLCLCAFFLPNIGFLRGCQMQRPCQGIGNLATILKRPTDHCHTKRFSTLRATPRFGDTFGKSLGGSQAPPSFWKVPGLPRKFHKLPRKFFSDLPGSFSLSLWNLTAIQGSLEFSQTSPKFPGLPRKFPGLPRRLAPFSGKPDTLS